MVISTLLRELGIKLLLWVINAFVSLPLLLLSVSLAFVPLEAKSLNDPSLLLFESGRD